MGDIVICSPTKEKSNSNSITLLNFLADRGYRVSPENVQISKQKVQYSGYELTPGRRTLSPDRKKAILDLGPPGTEKQLCPFLGMAGFCHLWIPGFGLSAKPLYDSVKGPDEETLL